MSGLDYSNYGTLGVGTTVITFPAIVAGQVIIVHADSPESLGVSNLSIAGAGATWTDINNPTGAPITFAFIGLTPTIGATSVTITAAQQNVGVGSYVISIWTFSNPIGPTFSSVNGSSNPNNVAYTTATLSYVADQVLLGASSAYDTFASGTPPTWSNGESDNLVQYQVVGSGTRPLWVSWSRSSAAGSTTYTSPVPDTLSTGASVVVVALGILPSNQNVMIL